MLTTIAIVGAPATLSEQRTAAFETVYAEGRWYRGVDDALCKSGWSSVQHGQAKAAATALKSVVVEKNIEVVLDIPVGDGCFAEQTLRLIRLDRNLTYHGAHVGAHDPTHQHTPTRIPPVHAGLDIVASLVESNRQRFGGEATSFSQADITTLKVLPLPSTGLPSPNSLIFSRQMTQHM